MGDRQRQLAEAILKDPDVVNVQSFVGVDAQNQTLNEGRVLIDLKPLGQRHTGASEIIRNGFSARPAACRASPSTCSRCRI